MGSYVVAASGGFGIAQMPMFLARPLLDDGRRVRVLPDWRVPPVPLHVVFPPHRHLSNKLRVFVDWAVTLFAAALPAAAAVAAAGTPSPDTASANLLPGIVTR